MFHSRRFSAAALLLSLALVAAACGNDTTDDQGGDSLGDPTTSADPEATEDQGGDSIADPTTAPEPEAAEPVTITVWDSFLRDVETPVIEGLISEFEAEHPGVTINREAKAFDDIDATIELALSGDDGPDVFPVNQGESAMGALVRAGLVADLSPYYDSFGWSDVFPSGLAVTNSFTGDGQTYGEGNLYGISPIAEIVGVYYRKDIFEGLGLSVPETLAEFESNMATLKDAGETPIAFGNLDRWPIMHIFSSLQGTYLGENRAYLDDLTFARGGVTWDDPANLDAIAKFTEWADAGYYTDGYEGIGYDDSTALFDGGQGAMMLTGSWMASTFEAGPNADNIGFFLLPPLEKGESSISTGGTATAFAISASSPNPDVAAQYIDWMMSSTAAEAWQAIGTLPVAIDEAAAAADTGVFGDLVRAWGSANNRNAVGHYSDKPSPGTFDVEAAAFQEVLAGRITPADAIADLDEDYIAFLEEKGVR